MENKWPPLEECVQYKSGWLDPYLRNFVWEHDDGDETHFEYQTGDEGEGGDGDEDDSSHKVEIKDDSSHKVEIKDDSSHKVEIKDDSSDEDEYDSSDELEEDEYESSEDDGDDSSDEDGGVDYVSRRELITRRRKFRFRYKLSTLRKFIKQVRESRGYYVNGKGLPRFMCNRFFRCNDLRRNTKTAKLGIELAIKEINSKTGKVYKHVETLVLVMIGSVILVTFTAKVVDDKEVEADETFLATVNAPGRAVEKFELLECLLKPEGPAPWSYVDRPHCCV